MHCALLLLSLAVGQADGIEVAPTRSAAEPTSSAPSDGEAAQAPLRVLVLDIQPGSLPEDVTVAAGDLIAVALGDIDGLEVSSGADLKRAMALEGEKAALGCGDESCLGEIAGALGADLVIFGRGAKLGDINVINLSLFDSSTSRTIERETIHFSNASELLEKVPAAVAALTADEIARRAGVVFTAPQPAPEVTTDPPPGSDNDTDKAEVTPTDSAATTTGEVEAPPEQDEGGVWSSALYWTGGALVGGSLGTAAVLLVVGWAVYIGAEMWLGNLRTQYLATADVLEAQQIATTAENVFFSYSAFGLLADLILVTLPVFTLVGAALLTTGWVVDTFVEEE